MAKLDRTFAEKFLTSIDDFDLYGVHLLFNDWWEAAPIDVVDKYEAAIRDHPIQGPLAEEGWFAPAPDMSALKAYEPGTLGAAYRRFVIDNNLEEALAAGYKALHKERQAADKLDRMPDLLQYKVLRGYQTHDIHHVLTGYPPDRLGELALQAFGLAQNNYPYAGMWIATVTAHMTFLNPDLMEPAMDAIADGWSFGREANNLQLVKFEHEFGRPLQDIQIEYGLYPRCLHADGASSQAIS